MPTISSLRVDNFFLIERAGKAEAELTRLRAQQTVLVDALKALHERFIDDATETGPNYGTDRDWAIDICNDINNALATLDVPPEKQP